MKKLISMFKDFYDSFFAGILILAILFGLFISVLGNSTFSSLAFKSSFIFIGLWLLFKTFFNLKSRNKWSCFLLDSYFISLILIGATAVILLLIVIIPALQLHTFSFSYLQKYIQCIFSLLALLLFANAKLNKYLVKIIILCSLMLGVLFVVGSFSSTIRDRTYTGAYTFRLGNPNTTALVLFYISLVLFYGVFIFRTIVFKCILVLTSAAMLVLVYFTQSRNPFVAIIFAAVFILFYLKFRVIEKKYTIFSIILVSSIILFASVYFLYINFLTKGVPPQAIVESASGKGYITRYEVWTDAFKKISEHLIEGNYYLLDGAFQYHNSILDSFVAYGFIGGLLCCVVVVRLIHSHVLQHKNILISQNIGLFCFISFFFTGFFEASLFNSPQGTIILFLGFISYSKIPMASDCITENNALYFGKKTPKNCDILFINSVFEKGSTGKILKSLVDFESKEHDVMCLYGRKTSKPYFNVAKCCTEFESKLNHLIGFITGDSYLFNFLATFEIIRIIKKYKPKLVHIHNLNDYYVNQYLLLHYLKSNQIQTLITLHSENLYVGCQEGHVFDCDGWCNEKKCNNCAKKKNHKLMAAKWKRMQKSIVGFNELSFTAVSPWLAERASKSTLLKDFKISVVLNGIDRNLYLLSKSAINTQATNSVLFVCADTKNPLKGFNFFVSLANCYEKRSNLSFISLSLEKNNFISLPSNMIVLDPVRDIKKLVQLYKSSKVTIILSARETFSMPVAESLVCGRPVVGFVCGGAESICLPKYCSFVEYGNLDQLKQSLDNMLKQNFNEDNIIEEAFKKYSDERMCFEYEEIYKGKAVFNNILEELDI